MGLSSDERVLGNDFPSFLTKKELETQEQLIKTHINNINSFLKKIEQEEVQCILVEADGGIYYGGQKNR